VETVLQIVQVVTYLSVTVLCVYLIVALTSIRRDFAEFVNRSKPVLDNLAFITERLKSTAQKIDEHVDILKSSLNSFKSVADNILMLEERVQQQIEEPVIQVASILGAIVSGVATLIERFRPRG
jgi:CHASE1-domain containing sensor protein